jgi:UDP-N-acetylglucosamine--N-acetylmuramyl-(pentapeptide) pyrophosphoryl-undecaprenol N-acetylglucosamine transferase
LESVDLLLAGGGTGGHTVAATVIADLARDLGHQVAWAARPDSYESKVAAENQIRFLPQPAYRLRPRNVPQLAAAVLQARRLVRRLRPRLVVTTGSWVCLPVALAARWAQVPLVVHEQTLAPGSATTWLSRWAAETWLTYADSAAGFPASARLVQTGFPLRPALRQVLSRAQALARFDLADQPTLFVAGGGSGAESLNAYLDRHLPELLPVWQIIHQTGAAAGLTTTAERLRARRADLPEALRQRYYLDQYFEAERVNAALRGSSLVLGRAGAGFVNEVAQLGRQAVLVPYPHSAKGEQEALAQALAATGRVVVWDDADLRHDDPAKLARLLDWTELEPTGAASPVLTTAQSVERLTERLAHFLPPAEPGEPPAGRPRG